MYGIQSHVLRDSMIEFCVAFEHRAAKYGYIKRVTMFNFADARFITQEVLGLQGQRRRVALYPQAFAHLAVS